jgi:UDP-GlcNAc3NAcA epimerase
LNIVSIVGARPQFVKAAVVSRALRNMPNTSEVLVHTGQHYDQMMSAVFFEELGIPEANFNLGIGSGAHGMQTGRMLEEIERVLLETVPDWVLVYGDTNSTLAGALAASKLHIRVAHVEAGLRSFNRRMPEETNRVLTDHIADILFAPTDIAVKNLKNEGITDGVERSGDVMFDASLFYGQRAEEKSDVLETLGLRKKKFVLATVHRAENTDDVTRLTAIFDAFSELAGEVPVVVPLHPRTRAVLAKKGKSNWEQSLRIITPLGYLDMLRLEKNAALIATDSGGVQKEAYFYKVPCVTLRDETEWVELVNEGWNHLAPPTSAKSVLRVLRDSIETHGTAADLYGDGHSAEYIAKAICGSKGSAMRSSVL